MLGKKIETALNEHFKAELYSSYLYLAMAAWSKGENLPGFASWLEAQAEEEMLHALKFYRFLDEREGRVIFPAIEAPPVEWESPQDLFNAVLDHERLVTGKINNLVKIARDEVDMATEIFLQWFVSEQVEEEASVNQIVKDMERLGENTQGLFMLDRELGARKPTSTLFNPGPDA